MQQEPRVHGAAVPAGHCIPTPQLGMTALEMIHECTRHPRFSHGSAHQRNTDTNKLIHLTFTAEMYQNL